MAQKKLSSRKPSPVKPPVVRFNDSTLQLLRQLQEVADKENHLENFLEETARILSQAFAHDRVTLFLFDEPSQELFFVKGWKTDKGFFPYGYRQKVNLGLMGKAVRNRRPLIEMTFQPTRIFCLFQKSRSVPKPAFR